MRSIRIATFLLALTSAGPALARPAGEGPVPVVVAVDTSRSLTPRALGAVIDRLRPALQGLGADTPTGLIAFDDEPRWIHEPDATPAAAAQALDALTPRGDFTLLHDALFVAVEALDGGGVVLLATDGRDENSAVTVDDIARRSREQNVRIVALGTGGRVEQRALRRLALLTNGTYLGRIDAAGATEIAGAVEAARDGVRAARAQHSRPAARADPEPPGVTAGTPAAGEPPSRSPQGDAVRPAAADGGAPAGRRPAEGREVFLGWALVLLAAALLAMAAAAVLFLRRGRPPQGAEHPQGDPEPEPAPVPATATPGVAVLRQELLERPIARQIREVTGDTAPVPVTGFDPPVETTRVLVERGILTVREPGKAARSFEIDGEHAFTVGRTSEGNLLSILDTALSSHHFRIVPAANRYYFIDLESTNGSSINAQRVSEVQELRSGDMIRAGMVEFEFRRSLAAVQATA